MASLHKEAVVDASPDSVWDAVRDVGAIHTRLAKGFVTDTRMDGTSRIVTFASGMTARELIVTVDDRAKRLAWAVVDSPRLTHHNASLQVFADGNGGSRLVWIADLLPNEMAEPIGGMIDQGLRAMKHTLELLKTT